MAKSPEKLYELVRQNPRECTLQQIEKLLQAFGFQRGRRSRRNEHLRAWFHGSHTLTLHKPHGRTMKIGAVKQALAEIDKVRALQAKNSKEHEDALD